MTSLSRRALIAGVLATGVIGPTLARSAGPAAASDAASRLALAQLELDLIADHDRALALLPSGSARTWVSTRRRLHRAHLRALAALGPVPQVTSTPVPRPPASSPAGPVETGSSTTTETTTATTDPTDLLLAKPDSAMRWLAERERRAHVRMRAITLASTDLATARVGALSAACERTHRVWDLAAQPSRAWTPGPSTDERLVLALDLALTHHHASLWTLGRLGPSMSGRDNGRARTMHAEHGLWRDRTRMAIRALGGAPSGPAPSYLLPTFSPTTTAARTIARDMERATAAAWLAVFVVATDLGDDTTQRAAFQALGDSAVRAALMGNVEAFPGFGDQLNSAL